MFSYAVFCYRDQKHGIKSLQTCKNLSFSNFLKHEKCGFPLRAFMKYSSLRNILYDISVCVLLFNWLLS